MKIIRKRNDKLKELDDYLNKLMRDEGMSRCECCGKPCYTQFCSGCIPDLARLEVDD